MTVTLAKKRATLTRRMARQPEIAIVEVTPPATAERTSPAKPQTKAALVSELLMGEGGASLDRLCQATGWHARLTF